MSGTIQFDEAAILDRAMTVFRTNGYAGTSLSELESVTQLNKSSIYNTYESKMGLYTACLERFRNDYTSQALAKLDQDDFETAIWDFCDCLFGGFETEKQASSGCLASLAALEMGSQNTQASQSIQTGLNDMLLRIEQRCQQAIKEGQLSVDWDSAELAAMIVAVSRGVVVLNMGTGNRKSGNKAYQCLLSQITSK